MRGKRDGVRLTFPGPGQLEASLGQHRCPANHAEPAAQGSGLFGQL